jgi:hypothetical protein
MSARANDLSPEELMAVLDAELNAMLADARMDFEAIFGEIGLNGQEADKAKKKAKKNNKPSTKKEPGQ